MLAINLEEPPLMRRMHRPDPKRPQHMQHKRSVVPIELEAVDQWLCGTVEPARERVRRAPVEAYGGTPGP